MHLHLSFALLPCLILPLLSATPTVAQDSSTPPNSVSTTAPSSTIHDSTTVVRPPSSSNPHKLTVGVSHPGHVISTPKPPIFTNRPVPTHSFGHSPAPSASQTPQAQHTVSVASIVLEVLGALAGVIFLLSLLRCLYIYYRTPARDRVTAILHRHQLQREMEELERNPRERRRSLEPPPPPYLPPPPSYDNEHTPLSRLQSVSSYADGQLPPNG
ncbi:hypothetical protein DFH07DRAFT_1061613 [Mycena maculata]|uniref:Uncharacterized protein n=1 Tax=Mycena maculata TaxID=230809 RepID=A0AAD7NB23_9AGAR|nr:hypothetical protein DFH07DRAFT_1061613 [Mycena maculata]